MFNSLQPPLLVQPVSMMYSTLFPTHEGYCIHAIGEAQALVSYKDGWTFPLSCQQQKYVAEPPMLFVKEAGKITSAGSTFSKGYAHHFCEDSGKEPAGIKSLSVFPDQPDEMWMLVPNTITMIWLQYGNKNQYCGDSGYEMERIYYGKLLIRKFDIEEYFMPRLGKDAADPALSAKQYRVRSSQIYNGNWSLSDQDTNHHLNEVLISQKLERYHPAVTIALKRAGYRG